LTLKKGTGVSSFTGAGTYEYGVKAPTNATASTGYHLTKYTGTLWDGSGESEWPLTTTSTGPDSHDNTWTMGANRTITVYAEKDTYTLTITNGTGYSIKVTRNGSALSNNATITYGDVLTISVTAQTGYNTPTLKVNGSSFNSGSTHTVTGAVNITASTSVRRFSLSLSSDSKSAITVNRTDSPLQQASIGNLSTGATIYYNDVLKIVFKTSAGYELVTHTVNGKNFTSNNSHIVKGDVTIVSTSKPMGLIRIYDGSKWKTYMVYIYVDDTKKWKQHVPYLYDNGWKLGG
jgi:hypothetical protein